MSIEIPVSHVQQFLDSFILLSQQKDSRLINTVRVEKTHGRYINFERIGPTAMQLRTSRHGDSPMIDTPHSRRRASMNDYEWGDMVDKQDLIRMLADPTSTYLMNAAAAAGRQQDDIIIAAATGTASSVDSDFAASSVALPAGQSVGEDVGATNSNLNFEKIKRAKRILDENEIPDDNRILVVNSNAIENLLSEVELTSHDYNTVRTLVNGGIDSFMGFRFVRSERLLGTKDGTDTDPVLCLAYHRDSIGVAMGMMPEVHIDPARADKGFNPYLMTRMSLGAVRIEDAGVVSIECVQS